MVHAFRPSGGSWSGFYHCSLLSFGNNQQQRNSSECLLGMCLVCRMGLGRSHGGWWGETRRKTFVWHFEFWWCEFLGHHNLWGKCLTLPDGNFHWAFACLFHFQWRWNTIISVTFTILGSVSVFSGNLIWLSWSFVWLPVTSTRSWICHFFFFFFFFFFHIFKRDKIGLFPDWTEDLALARSRTLFK